MLSVDSRVVPFAPPAHQLTLAHIVSVMTAEPDVRTGGIILCLACKLAQLAQRVLLIDLDATNEIAELCGVKSLAGSMEDLAGADRAYATATSCIAANKPLVPDVRFNFHAVNLVPAGLQSNAAITTLIGLSSHSTSSTILTASSLQRLRKQYDYILLNPPATYTPLRRQNSLADFALSTTHVVLMVYLTVDPFSRTRFLECAQFIRSSCVASGGRSPCEVWMVPLDDSTDGTLLQQVQSRLAPNPARRLAPLSYGRIVQELMPLQHPLLEVPHRVAHARSVSARFFDDLARQCLSLRE